MQSSRHSLAAAADEYDFFAKVVLVGDKAVGKSELLISMVDQPGIGFSRDYRITVGADFNNKHQQISGKTIKLQIWDIPGQERYRSLASTCYRGSHVILLCYDITNKESFENLSKWQSEISQYAPENAKVILVGIKSDLEAKRPVTIDEAQAFATKYDYGFMEVSNKSRNNTYELRQLVAETFYKSVVLPFVHTTTSTTCIEMSSSSSSSPSTPSQSINLKTPGLILLASSAALWLFSSPATLAKVALYVTFGQLAKAGMVIGAAMTAYGFFQSRRDRDDDFVYDDDKGYELI